MKRWGWILFWLPLSAGAAVTCELPEGYEVPRPGEISAANRRRLAADVVRVALRHRLEPALVEAVIAAESGFNPVASHGARAQSRPGDPGVPGPS
jgi:hypothetical protein